MNTHPAGRHGPDGYEIRLQGRLDPRWSTYLDNMSVLTDPDPAGGGPVTILRGRVVDQSALHGLLTRLRDIGLPLVSITRVDLDQDG